MPVDEPVPDEDEVAELELVAVLKDDAVDTLVDVAVDSDERVLTDVCDDEPLLELVDVAVALLEDVPELVPELVLDDV